MSILKTTALWIYAVIVLHKHLVCACQQSVTLDRILSFPVVQLPILVCLEIHREVIVACGQANSLDATKRKDQFTTERHEQTEHRVSCVLDVPEKKQYEKASSLLRDMPE